ncbi:hypothetical protein GBW32_04405 [Streptomyces tsukubensis]|nr:hypothetical protein GBW32_04405 [Streptomyces tsukubensis]
MHVRTAPAPFPLRASGGPRTARPSYGTRAGINRSTLGGTSDSIGDMFRYASHTATSAAADAAEAAAFPFDGARS